MGKGLISSKINIGLGVMVEEWFCGRFPSPQSMVRSPVVTFDPRVTAVHQYKNQALFEPRQISCQEDLEGKFGPLVLNKK